MSGLRGLTMRTFAISTVFTLFIGILILMNLPEPLQHPCHPGGPGGPGGPPCPPTQVPDPGGAGSALPVDDSNQISFLVKNRTGENVTLWIGDPIRYVLNVPGKTEMTFTVNRGVYVYDLSSCGWITGGYLNLTIHTFIEIAECETQRLVAVNLSNLSGTNLALQLSGPADYIISLDPGQILPVTIARGDYEAILIGCSVPATVGFAAHAGRTIEFTCP